MSFELAQLREAAEKYLYHDAGTHGVWSRLVWERRNVSPVARLDDAVEFLGKWKALHSKAGRQRTECIRLPTERNSGLS